MNKSSPLKDRRTFFAESNGSLVRISSPKTAHDRLDLVLKGPLQFGLEQAIEQPLVG